MCIIIQIGHHRCCIMKNMSTNGDDQNLWASTPTAISSTPVSMSSSSFGGFLKVGSPVIIPVMTMKETVTWGWPMTQETPISIPFPPRHSGRELVCHHEAWRHTQRARVILAPSCDGMFQSPCPTLETWENNGSYGRFLKWGYPHGWMVYGKSY